MKARWPALTEAYARRKSSFDVRKKAQHKELNPPIPPPPLALSCRPKRFALGVANTRKAKLRKEYDKLLKEETKLSAEIAGERPMDVPLRRFLFVPQ